MKSKFLCRKFVFVLLTLAYRTERHIFNQASSAGESVTLHRIGCLYLTGDGFGVSSSGTSRRLLWPKLRSSGSSETLRSNLENG